MTEQQFRRESEFESEESRYHPQDGCPLFSERLLLNKRSELRFSVPGAAPAVVQCRYNK